MAELEFEDVVKVEPEMEEPSPDGGPEPKPKQKATRKIIDCEGMIGLTEKICLGVVEATSTEDPSNIVQLRSLAVGLLEEIGFDELLMIPDLKALPVPVRLGIGLIALGGYGWVITAQAKRAKQAQREEARVERQPESSDIGQIGQGEELDRQSDVDQAPRESPAG